MSNLPWVRTIAGIGLVSTVLAATAFAQAGKQESKTSPGSPAATTAKSTRPTGLKTASKTSTKARRTVKSKRSRSKIRRARGQQAIDTARATEIQQALIREKYLDGEPTGVWDQRTKDAIARYQADNGWQTKVLPDSRALIKLGLGPDHSNLINPDTAATAHPATAANKQ